MKGLFNDNQSKYFKLVNDFETQNYNSTLTYIILDMENCENSLELLESIQKYFDLTYKWILLMDKSYFENFVVKAKTVLTCGVDSDITVVVFNGEFAVLYQPYKIRKIDPKIGIHKRNFVEVLCHFILL